MPTITRTKQKQSKSRTPQTIEGSSINIKKEPAIIEDDGCYDTVKKSPRKNRKTRTAREADKTWVESTKSGDIAACENNWIEGKVVEEKKSAPLQVSNKELVSIITPSTDTPEDLDTVNDAETNPRQVRRALKMAAVRSISESSGSSYSSVPGLTEVSSSSFSDDDDQFKHEQELQTKPTSHEYFKSKINVPENVKKVYAIVNKMSGSLGGNGSGGAIYGELTVGSMQKMVNLMKKHMDFNETSRFIDVGCGLGKPNMHVAQDPGVQFSYGIEMEKVRWLLGMHNLNHVLKEAKKDKDIGHRCILEHGNIIEANSFNPFTHVYMFDIGFPPALFHKLSEMFNSSDSNFLVCYHGPKLMIDRYKFNVELIEQTSTSMHGSSESHMGYLYKRIDMKKPRKKVQCDKLFEDAWKQTSGSMDTLSSIVEAKVHKEMDSCIARRTRSSTFRSKQRKQ